MPGAGPTSDLLSKSGSIPSWITLALMSRTRQVLEPRYGHPLSDDEIVSILVAVGAVGDFLRGESPLDNSDESDPPKSQQLQEIA